MPTFSIKAKDIKHSWYLIDANGKVLGRLASKIATRLRGKDKPVFTPHMDVGDCIVVINADKIRVTGKKLTDKIYYRHSQYPGGITATSLRKMLAEKPTRVLESAVKNMLPKGPLGRKMFSKLKVYAGAEHPHSAQQPQILTIEE
jgi:large subunit ribosomal protein L13